MMKSKGVPQQKPLFHFPPHPLHLLLLLLFLFLIRASELRNGNQGIWYSLSSCSTSLTDLSLSLNLGVSPEMAFLLNKTGVVSQFRSHISQVRTQRLFSTRFSWLRRPFLSMSYVFLSSDLCSALLW